MLRYHLHAPQLADTAGKSKVIGRVRSVVPASPARRVFRGDSRLADDSRSEDGGQRARGYSQACRHSDGRERIFPKSISV